MRVLLLRRDLDEDVARVRIGKPPDLIPATSSKMSTEGQQFLNSWPFDTCRLNSDWFESVPAISHTRTPVRKTERHPKILYACTSCGRCAKQQQNGATLSSTRRGPSGMLRGWSIAEISRLHSSTGFVEPKAILNHGDLRLLRSRLGMVKNAK